MIDATTAYTLPDNLLTGTQLKGDKTMITNSPKRLTTEERLRRDRLRDEELSEKRARFNDGAPLSGNHIAKLADLPTQICIAYRKREYGFILKVNEDWYFSNAALNRACSVGTPTPFKFKVVSTDRTYQDSKVFDIEFV